MNFSRTYNSVFTDFNLPSASSIIYSADLIRLQNLINDELGRVGLFSQAFVSDPNNPSTYASGGTRWENIANYPELDFYVQDNWRVAPNFIVDLGLRWELKFAPRSATGRPILAPDQSIVLGAAATDSLKWVDKPLFDDDFTVFLPSADLRGIRLRMVKHLFAVILELLQIGWVHKFFGASIFKAHREILLWI